MPPSRLSTDETGSASLEFLTAGLILLLPLVYLVLAVSGIQAAALAVEGAARQGARVFVQGASSTQAQAAAIRAIDFALADHGIEPGSASISVTCAPRPAACLTRRGFVTVSVVVSVPLPLLPPVLEGDFPLVVPMSAQATQQVSRFWGSE
jgi:Flp pilus assembly protein TadG